jgi:hypothetical protein
MVSQIVSPLKTNLMAAAGKVMTIADEVIVNKIYLVREQKVMIDRDLAELYGVETKALKQAVRRGSTDFSGIEETLESTPRAESQDWFQEERRTGVISSAIPLSDFSPDWPSPPLSPES